MEKALQEVVRDAAALRRDFVRLGLTNSQRNALEGSAVFRETELGYVIEDSEAAGLDMALLAQVWRMRTRRAMTRHSANRALSGHRFICSCSLAVLLLSTSFPAFLPLSKYGMLRNTPQLC